MTAPRSRGDVMWHASGPARRSRERTARPGAGDGSSGTSTGGSRRCPSCKSGASSWPSPHLPEPGFALLAGCFGTDFFAAAGCWASPQRPGPTCSRRKPAPKGRPATASFSLPTVMTPLLVRGGRDREQGKTSGGKTQSVPVCRRLQAERAIRVSPRCCDRLLAGESVRERPRGAVEVKFW